MRLILTILLSTLILFQASGNEARFASVFSDNMVLQQNDTVALWGFAKPGEKVKIACSWLNEQLSAEADNTGKWYVEVNTPEADFTPHTITLTDSRGDNTTLRNILLGEVWLCSGQSNMEMILMSQPDWNLIVENSEEELANANNSFLRVLAIGRKESFIPVEEAITYGWKETTPENSKWFSAVAYFFGKELASKLKVPVGLIVSSYGGSPVQSWMPLETLMGKEIYKECTSKRDSELRASFQSEAEYYNAMSAWISESERTSVNSNEEIILNLPINLEKSPVGNQMGEVSFKRAIEISQEDSGKELHISLGTMDDLGRVYFNGELFWEEIRNSKSYSRVSFTVPAEKVRAGTNLIEVKVLNILWGGGLTGPAKDMYFTIGNYPGQITLTGSWHYNKVFDTSGVKPMPLEGKPLFSTSSALYNGMIYPIRKYKIKGAIWYQGEENVSQASVYSQMLADMVDSWRNSRGNEFPFYYVQIAPYQYGGYNDNAAASLREAQSAAEEIIEGSGMVVTMDIGDQHNIHPARKMQVGLRLANMALSNTYKIPCASVYPKVKSVKASKESVIITFTGTGKGLVAKGEKHEFDISDDGINYVPAEVKICSSRIKVSNGQIKRARYVRYCWRDGAEGTIFNSDNLPLSSFRVKAY